MTASMNASHLPRYQYPTNEEECWKMLESHPQLLAFKEDRKELKKLKWSPKYHYYAPYIPNIMNDPNGLCYWNGNYHLFYQQTPPGETQIHWGHLISKDLVHWQDLPTAIFPGPEKQCWSGGACVEKDRVLAVYYGLDTGEMISEASDPLLLNFKKIIDAPVIPTIPTDENGRPYRVFDPFLWKEGDNYYLVSGTFTGKGPKLLQGTHRMVSYLFTSKDLLEWEFIGELMPDNPFYGMANDTACPYFFPLGNKQMLLHFSHTDGGPHCLIGDYDKEKHLFSPKQHYLLSKGEGQCGGLHAPCATPDGNGGCYAVFNMKDANPPHKRQGAMSLSRHMSLGNDGRLRMKPVEQVESLRTTVKQYAAEIKDREPFMFHNAGDCCEMNIDIDMKTARSIRLRVLCDEKQQEYTDIVVTYRKEDEAAKGISYPYIRQGQARVYLTLDSQMSSLSPDVWPRAAETLDGVFPIDEKLHLRVFIDRCIVEVFLNDRLALSQMVYPTLDDSVHASLMAVGGHAEILNAQVWQMASIYPD